LVVLLQQRSKVHVLKVGFLGTESISWILLRQNMQYTLTGKQVTGYHLVLGPIGIDGATLNRFHPDRTIQLRD